MKILIVDDHVVVREGVRRLLSTVPDVEVYEAGNARDALDAYRKWLPDIVVLDINMDGSSGLEFLQRLRAISKSARVIMFTMHAEPGYVTRALRAGAAWELEIQREIRRCDVFVVLYSPDINRHLSSEDESYVLTEISYAKFTAKKPIIPIMAQRTDPPISLTMTHYIDFTIGGLTLADLVEAICDEVGQIVPAVRSVEARRTSSTELLPQPFAWVEIPAGQVTLEERSYLNKPMTINVPAFSIAKYPVTNAQYALFVDAGGYGERKWWTDSGWSQCKQEKWIEPRYWRRADWNQTDHPVVGVSWYEAGAYCRWLSETTGETILLPGEQQWQRAGQGDDGRAYPWGNEWNAGNAVWNRSSSQGTANAGSIPAGRSWVGALDMSGNVWEWLSSLYLPYDTLEDREADTGSGTDVFRTLRGGSWNIDNVAGLRAADRGRNDPIGKGYVIGFRCARSS